MSVPNPDRVIVSREKVRDYLLSLSHPVGRGKAVWLLNLGYTRAGWRLLRDQIRELAWRPATEVPSPFGAKFIVQGTITAPTGRSLRVVTVWLLPYGERRVRLVTMYPGAPR